MQLRFRGGKQSPLEAPWNDKARRTKRPRFNPIEATLRLHRFTSSLALPRWPHSAAAPSCLISPRLDYRELSWPVNPKPPGRFMVASWVRLCFRFRLGERVPRSRKQTESFQNLADGYPHGSNRNYGPGGFNRHLGCVHIGRNV